MWGNGAESSSCKQYGQLHVVGSTKQGLRGATLRCMSVCSWGVPVGAPRWGGGEGGGRGQGGGGAARAPGTPC